jgi:hypothetical protein
MMILAFMNWAGTPPRADVRQTSPPAREFFGRNAINTADSTRQHPLGQPQRILMKPKDIFGLAVRLLGLVFFYRGVVMLPVGFASGWMLLHVALLLALGWWLVGGARLLLNRAYPASSEVPAPPTIADDAPPRQPN